MNLSAGAVQELEEDVMALEGGSFISRGILGSRSWDVWLLPEYLPSPSFPIPLPAVARWFGSLGLTRV